MTAEEIYALPVQESTLVLESLWGCYYNHMPEVSDLYWGVFDQAAEEGRNTRVEIRKHFKFWFDFRRYWQLASVWIDGKPFMIIQNAGREGDDHRHRFITDTDTFWVAVAYLRSIVDLKKEMQTDDTTLLDPREDRTDLDRFYGDVYGGYFNRYDF